MARITVEDCIDKFTSRFELVLVASNRARKIHSGESPTVDKDNDKPTVIALREIASDTVSVDALKEKLIEEYQIVSPLEEEDLSLDYADSENKMNDQIIEDKIHLNDGKDEKNISNEDQDNSTEDNSTEDNSTEDNSTEDNSTEDNSTEDNSHLSEGNEANFLKQDDNSLPPTNDGYAEISDDNESKKIT